MPLHRLRHLHLTARNRCLGRKPMSPGRRGRGVLVLDLTLAGRGGGLADHGPDLGQLGRRRLRDGTSLIAAMLAPP